jgi:D-sedoheptulose 7-phosphate isomerase
MATVFTNGCFDLLHPGHVDLLDRARALGDRLIVGLNSDRSVRALKGAGRPLLPQEARASILRALRSVDEVIIFGELTPARLIEALQPDILVKGGDWPLAQIVGAEAVWRKGGRVLSLPLQPGYSTTALVEKITHQSQSRLVGLSRARIGDDAEKTPLMRSLREHVETIEHLAQDCLPAIQRAAEMIIAALQAGKKLLLCGNGGSAADAQHIAAEFVGRFERERRPYPAIALTTDTSKLTAIGNDYGFEQLFARQVQGLATPRDVLVAISTSGHSPNIQAAAVAARRLGCRTIGLTGVKGKRLASLCDVAVMVPSERTSRIQEAHLTIGHLWCELADSSLREALAPSVTHELLSSLALTAPVRPLTE